MTGLAGLPLDPELDGFPKLDGISAWPSLLKDAPSARTEMLLNLQGGNDGYKGETKVWGQGAYRMGKYKLLKGHTCVWGQKSAVMGCGSCASRDGKFSNNMQDHGWENPWPSTNITTPRFCPNGACAY